MARCRSQRTERAPALKRHALAALGAALLASAGSTTLASAVAKGIELGNLRQIAEVDPNFQSFNVEMVEVTGGRFWAPYTSKSGERYAQRPPIDLNNVRLRVLAKALAPAFMRVSGTWANSTYIPTMTGEEPASPPPGFKQVLKRSQWQDVVRFSNDLGLPIVTSFPVSDGTRDSVGRWRPDQAERLLALTRRMGGRIAAAEFFNEPNLAKLGGLPAQYAAVDYARDFVTFRAFARQFAPAMVILGPGSSGEGGDVRPTDMMRETAGGVDAVSYHFYGALSQRCKDFGNQTGPADALTEAWLSRTEADYRFYAGLRDHFEPGKPIWLTETAQAACGGSAWAATYRDTFRYVDQMGRLARLGVRVVAHNTLAASDYALIDGETLVPRPSYWAAVLWRRLMGTIVLESPIVSLPDVKIYAHCLRRSREGVALLVENFGDVPRSLALRGHVSGYVITAPSLDSGTVNINGRQPALRASGAFPRIEPRWLRGAINLPARSISFFAVTGVANPACAKG